MTSVLTQLPSLSRFPAHLALRATSLVRRNVGRFTAVLLLALGCNLNAARLARGMVSPPNHVAALIQGNDGNFYGTIRGGDDFPYGAIFRLTPTGNLTVLHTFSRIGGEHPTGSLIQGGDGNFYGVTAGIYPGDAGTIFRLAPDGTLTTLHRFSGDDGDFPCGALVQAKDGNLYGTTVNGGGTNSYGVAFRLTLAGEFTVIHRFRMPDGGSRVALIQASDGKLYGTTSGGEKDRGTVFCLTLDGRHSVVLTPMTP